MAGEITQGHVLGRYELLLPIAAGGMAMVWAARVKGTRGFQKIVAVKTMLSKLSEDAQFEQMFLDEAQLASQIRHPNVVEISDLGEQDGVLYLAMEWIDGVPLNQLMKTAKAAGGVPLAISVRIVQNAAAGLHAAHELRDGKGQLIGLVHRDVSPQNILVTYDGVSKVVDFGVAKATAMGGGATVAGQLKGKVSYMAPEQVRGEPIDRRVDVFALGIVLYALTTGKHPFRRESEAATMYTIASDEVVLSPRKFLPDYPASLEAVLLKALAKDVKQRYATASELQRALDQCLPVTERANTDEDVGTFMRKLFGNKREESRAALAEALAIADKQGLLQNPTMPRPAPSAPLSEIGLSTGQRQADSTFSALNSPWDAARRKRIVVLSMIGAVLLVGAAVFALQRMDSDNTLPPPIALPTRDKPMELRPPSPAVDLETLPVEPSATSSATPTQARPPVPVPARVPVSPAPVAAPVSPPVAPAPLLGPQATVAAPPSSAKPPAKPTAPKWRQDPGF